MIDFHSALAKLESSSRKREYRAARSQLRDRGFAVLRGLMPHSVMDSLGRYYQILAAEGRMPFGDGQSLRYWAHNEQLASVLHREIHSALDRVIPEVVQPSYSYVCLYIEGAELPRHTDRPECEYTLSLAVHSTPTAAKPWPLYLEIPGRQRSFGARLGPGDGLVFRGREIPHYRKRLTGSDRVCTILFHFVPNNFPGPLD